MLLADFAAKTQHLFGALAYQKKSLLSDFTSPVLLFQALRSFYPCAQLYESVEQNKNWGRFSFLTFGSLIEVSGRESSYQVKVGEQVFALEAVNPLQILDFLDQALQIPIPVGGYFGYPIVRHFEKLPAKDPEKTLDDAYFLWPELFFSWDQVEQTLLVEVFAFSEEQAKQTLDRLFEKLGSVTSHQPLGNPFYQGKKSEPVLDYRSNTSQEEFYAMVRQAKDYIENGDIFQVVLSRKFEVDFKQDPFLFYRYLRVLNPSPYLFYLQFPNFVISGSSPEVLIKKEAELLTLRPIAGTKRRGATLEEDLAIEKELIEDPKELAEHYMLVDLGRNDLGRIATIGSVKLVRSLYVENYSHVKHIVSTIQAEALPNLSFEQMFRAVFPAGTLSGAPKIRAMEIIDALEKSGRSFYGGSVWFKQGESFNSCIAIRSAVFLQGKAMVQAGAGIVLDSVEQKEWEECENKAKALLYALTLAEKRGADDSFDR